MHAGALYIAALSDLTDGKLLVIQPPSGWSAEDNGTGRVAGDVGVSE